MQDIDFWQEQNHRADIIRSILERTLTIAQTWDLLEPLDNGWCYRGEEHTLTYQADSAQLSIVRNDQSWKLDWHEGLFTPGDRSHITAEQLASFETLGEWLKTVENSIPSLVQTDLTQTQADSLVHQAAQLFEYYASQGDTAFKFSDGSTEQFYWVQIEETVYLIGRDDRTGLYSLQREDENALTISDIRDWELVSEWVEQLTQKSTESYGEELINQANYLLPQARSLFLLNESNDAIDYDKERQSYITTFEDYTIGYTPDTDVFWLERRGERLFLALNFQQYPADSSYDLGSVSPSDVRRFEEWASWVRLKAEIDLQHIGDRSMETDSRTGYDYDL